MKTLKSMTDFVLNETLSWSAVIRLTVIIGYAEFLKQPLKLGMFVPCDEKGNVLREPKRTIYQDANFDIDEMNIYAEAKEKVLFKGFKIRNEKKKNFIGIEGYEIELPLKKYDITIEDLANDWRHIKLTESAIKQIFGNG